MGREMSGGAWSKKAGNQYEWLVRNALRLARHDGSHVFSANGRPWEEPTAGAWSAELFAAALATGGDEDDRDIAALALPGRKKADAKRVRRSALPEAALHSEWAAVTVLRTGWERSDPRLIAVWPEGTVRVELACGKDVLFSGTWDLEVRADGDLLAPRGNWDEVCWVSDDDIDYLELEIDLDGGLSVQRHMALAREDRILLVADSILGGEPRELEYRGRLPLAEGIAWVPAEETREGFLVGTKRQASVLPLALPEWRIEPGSGELEATGAGLELRRKTAGRSLFAPLLLDLDPLRVKRPLTWRRLTVGENMEILPDDVAVGYRVMAGQEQWLLYRSLAEPGNRTLLGHNLISSMLVGRFDEDGEVETLVEIE
jgi:hypothetical protein